jgi:hypothetical protein
MDFKKGKNNIKPCYLYLIKVAKEAEEDAEKFFSSFSDLFDDLNLLEEHNFIEFIEKTKE